MQGAVHVVLEYMSAGSLYDIIQRKGGSNMLRIRCLIDIAIGALSEPALAAVLVQILQGKLLIPHFVLLVLSGVFMFCF